MAIDSIDWWGMEFTRSTHWFANAIEEAIQEFSGNTHVTLSRVIPTIKEMIFNLASDTPSDNDQFLNEDTVFKSEALPIGLWWWWKQYYFNQKSIKYDRNFGKSQEKYLRCASLLLRYSKWTWFDGSLAGSLLQNLRLSRWWYRKRKLSKDFVMNLDNLMKYKN